MKTSSIIKSIAAAILLLNASSMLTAQTANNNTCPMGNQPGYCQTLTPEQRMVYRATVQKYVSELKQKQAKNQLTAEEQAWLKNYEQRGGMMGFGGGRGAGMGMGMGCGQGKGMGPRQGMGRRMGACDGTGPNCDNNGTCPLGNTPKAAQKP